MARFLGYKEEEADPAKVLAFLQKQEAAEIGKAFTKRTTKSKMLTLF
jgi:hypothetical protein